MRKNDLLFNKRFGRGILAAVLIISAMFLSGCGETGSERNDISGLSDIQAGASASVSSVTESSQYEQTSEAFCKQTNIVIDENDSSLYYFFSDDETVDLSNAESLDGIKNIHIIPLNKKYRFDKIIGFGSNQNTNGIVSLQIENGTLDDTLFIGNMGNLKEIRFSDCVVNDVSFFENLNETELLCMNDCIIDNISFLQYMPKIYAIDFDSTPISDISPITALNEIKTISLRNCEITDISAFSSFKNSNPEEYGHLFEKIDLSGNAVEDYSPLSGLNIHKLFLNSIKDCKYDTIVGLTVGTLYMTDNNITDISFLTLRFTI